MNISLDMYPYAGGSRAAQTLLHGRILVLAHRIHKKCISERFYKGLSDQKGNLNKKFASRRELCILHFYMDFQTNHTTGMCMNHIGVWNHKNSNFRKLRIRITGPLI